MTTVATVQKISSELSTAKAMSPILEQNIATMLSWAGKARFIVPEAMIKCKKAYAETFKAYVTVESCLTRAAREIGRLGGHKSVQNQKEEERKALAGALPSLRERLTLIGRHLTQHTEENALYDRLDAIKKRVFQIAFTDPSAREQLSALQAKLATIKMESAAACSSACLAPPAALLHIENQDALEELMGVLRPMILFTERKLQDKAKMLEQVESEKKLPTELPRIVERRDRLNQEIDGLLLSGQHLETASDSFDTKQIKIMAILGRFNRLKKEYNEVGDGLRALAETVSNSQNGEFKVAWGHRLQGELGAHARLQERLSACYSKIETFYVKIKSTHLTSLEKEFWTRMQAGRFEEASSIYGKILSLLQSLAKKVRVMEIEQAVYFETFVETTLKNGHRALADHGVTLERLPEAIFYRNINVHRTLEHLATHIRLCTEPKLGLSQALPGATSLLHLQGIAEELPRYLDGLPSEIRDLLEKPDAISALEDVMKARLLTREEVTAEITARVKEGLESLHRQLRSLLETFPQYKPAIAV